MNRKEYEEMFDDKFRISVGDWVKFFRINLENKELRKEKLTEILKNPSNNPVEKSAQIVALKHLIYQNSSY